MTDDDLQRERLLSYWAGYEAGKADAAKETCVVLTPQHRHSIDEAIQAVGDRLQRCTEAFDVDEVNRWDNVIQDLHAILTLSARSAQQADTVTVRREVLQRMTCSLKTWRGNPEFRDSCQCGFCEMIRCDETEAIAEAEAALAKGGE